ncbi:Ribosomal RNA small subunit methyltransferase C [Aliiroseovarius sp. xm-m-379]|uniref:class I SAM-dependent methyltransferase n=1 Tax=unclassified Aliiroseovarius TaxID=2623558 RepID=UPI0015684462|nr:MULTISPECIES: methyltransferase [unclassified Aliiroseovarius]NRP13822.1 Ribosomal RNA small subunit methyltransferase C [Aliiroseovarius sp. xm-d-517]NRP25533.1 Ribosomal RNA small subunit methyltransferase C [Aliiroseovarius sp. xm-m-379]NRP29525.1 Ribosomal RNA small subunit methyltransferase C [Aliiroseovarius sp. xm-m-314]NRP34332.1 Ribosomal RNA small subunit methyltransferase C [Aliiroseovarius sp. xm-a-104]NRP41709.1 Ribosomal RNA small subunit methyltransferase C [Aliiroseovarius s
MFHTRFALASGEAGLTLPEDGQIAIFGPTPDMDLSGLPRERTVIIAPDFPAHATWQAQGWSVSPTLPAQDIAAAIICVPRAKALAQAWAAEASKAAQGGLIVLDGQKTDGIDSLLKLLKKRASPDGVMSKAHGKIAWLHGADLSDWAAKDTVIAGDFITRPGVFSADGIDKGSAALIEALPQTLSGRVADLGAGWGYLSRHILAQDAVEHLDLIEANATALDCARRNITDPRAHFLWGDATTYLAKAPYDTVVSNPPFHTGRKGDPDLGRAFIQTAAKILKGAGQFIMVANRHLPYEDTLAQYFRDVSEIGGTSGFKVIRATRPDTKSLRTTR